METLEFNPNNQYLLFDLDRDGSGDILEVSANPDGSATAITWLNNDETFEKYAMTRSFTEFNADDQYILVDANNDNLFDLIQIWRGRDGTANATSYMQDETGRFGRFGQFTYNWDFGEFDPEISYLGVDFDGDGFQDIVHRNTNLDAGSIWTVYAGDGQGGFSSSQGRGI